MSVAQPTHLLIFNETSGTSVTNYGSDGTAYVIQQGTSTTDYEWVQQAQTPTGGYLDVKTKTGSNMPYMTTAASAFASTLTTINFACGFTVDSRETIVGQKLVVGNANLDARARIAAPTAGGDFNLEVRFWTTSSGGPETTFTNLTFGTFYQLAMSWDVSTPSVSQGRFKLNSAATVEPATYDAASQALTTVQPYCNRDEGFTNYGGNDGRFYYWAYQRGGTAWSSADLGDINTDPSAALTGWPVSMAFLSPLTFQASPILRRY